MAAATACPRDGLSSVAANAGIVPVMDSANVVLLSFGHGAEHALLY